MAVVPLFLAVILLSWSRQHTASQGTYLNGMYLHNLNSTSLGAQFCKALIEISDQEFI